jgi:hypothetical protein
MTGGTPTGQNPVQVDIVKLQYKEGQLTLKEPMPSAAQDVGSLVKEGLAEIKKAVGSESTDLTITNKGIGQPERLYVFKVTSESILLKEKSPSGLSEFKFTISTGELTYNNQKADASFAIEFAERIDHIQHEYASGKARTVAQKEG